MTIPSDVAANWIASYTDVTRHSSKAPSAYPVYDFLDTGSTPDELNDGDLLAPTLLNAAPSVSAFCRLQAISSDLETALQNCPNEPLTSVSDDIITETVGALYAVLDEDHESHPSHGLGGTTLSKVLHRKRPHFLCLHDQFVWSCYVEHGPISRARERSWEKYMVLLTKAMREDLASQEAEFAMLRQQVKGEALSDLRSSTSSRGRARASRRRPRPEEQDSGPWPARRPLSPSLAAKVDWFCSSARPRQGPAPTDGEITSFEDLYDDGVDFPDIAHQPAAVGGLP